MHKAFIVSSFTLNGVGGNKAGVVFESVNDSMKQLIAKELGFSETVFVEGNRFRYFTPNSEINFCGHATLAALSLMDYEELNIETNEFTIKAFKDPVPRFKTDNGKVINQPIDEESVLRSLGITYTDVGSYGMDIVYAGLNDLFIHVNDLSRVVPDYRLISKMSEELNVVGYHVYSLHDEYDANTRNFAPLYDINEESATGSANAGLAYLLSLKNPKKKYRFLQGEAMNELSEIIIVIDNGIYISGEASLLGTVSVGGKNVKA